MGGSGGGGGVSGAVDYAGDIKNYFFSIWDDVLYMIAGGSGATYSDPANWKITASGYDGVNRFGIFHMNPYESIDAYPPDSILSALRSEIDDFDRDVVSDSDPLSAISEYFDEAERLALASPSYGQASVDDAYAQFASRHRIQYLKTVARFSAAMGDIGAVQSSAYAVGLAHLEDGYDLDLARFNANLEVDMLKDRRKFVIAAVELMMKLSTVHWDSDRIKMLSEFELARITINAKNDELMKNLHINVKERLWGMDLLQIHGNVAAGLAGGVSPAPMVEGHKDDSGVNSSGALAGAAYGAAYGTSVSPGIGTIVGGVVGAVAGAFM